MEGYNAALRTSPVPSLVNISSNDWILPVLRGMKIQIFYAIVLISYGHLHVGCLCGQFLQIETHTHLDAI